MKATLDTILRMAQQLSFRITAHTSRPHVFCAGLNICRSESYAGVVPVALTNSAASASAAVEGAPVSGPGMTATTLVQDGSNASAKDQSPSAEAAEQVGSHISMFTQQACLPFVSVIDLELFNSSWSSLSS